MISFATTPARHFFDYSQAKITKQSRNVPDRSATFFRHRPHCERYFGASAFRSRELETPRTSSLPRPCAHRRVARERAPAPEGSGGSASSSQRAGLRLMGWGHE